MKLIGANPYNQFPTKESCNEGSSFGLKGAV